MQRRITLRKVRPPADWPDVEAFRGTLEFGRLDPASSHPLSKDAVVDTWTLTNREAVERAEEIAGYRVEVRKATAAELRKTRRGERSRNPTSKRRAKAKSHVADMRDQAQKWITKTKRAGGTFKSRTALVEALAEHLGLKDRQTRKYVAKITIPRDLIDPEI